MATTGSGNDTACITRAFERNRYFYGKLMTVRDFELEQGYLNEKRWLLNRLLFGSGTVSGLEIVQVASEAAKISVKPGAAIDPCGHEVLVVDEKVFDLSQVKSLDGNSITPPATDAQKSLNLSLVYHECQTEPVPALKPSTCEEICDYNRVRESYKLVWREVPADDGTGSRCGEWGNQQTIKAHDAQVMLERTTPLWVEASQAFEVAVKVTALQDVPAVSLREEVTGGEIIEPRPTPPSQFPLPTVSLRTGEFFIYVYQVRASSTAKSITVSSRNVTLATTINVVEDVNTKLSETFSRNWLDGWCSSANGKYVDLATVTLKSSNGSIIIADIDNVKPRRFVHNLTQVAQFLSCIHDSLSSGALAERPGHFLLTFKDFELGVPKPVGPTASVGSANTVLRGDHVHDLPLAPNAGLQFANNMLTMNGPAAGNAIDFLNPVSGQDPTNPRHLVTRQYVDAAMAGLDWQESVKSKSIGSPPANPAAGDRYLLCAQNLGGAWNGHRDQIVAWQQNAWVFTPPNPGKAVFVEDEGQAYLYMTNAWIAFLAAPNVAAGDGLKANGAILSVGQGAGIRVAADDVSLVFEGTLPRPIGELPSAGTNSNVARGDHAHGLPIADKSGLEFGAGGLRINGNIGADKINFLNTVSGQGPTEPGHLATKKYVDAAVASEAIPNGSIGTSKLADNAVTSSKLQSDAATNANRAVGSNHIQDGAVTAAKLADNSVSLAKLKVKLHKSGGVNIPARERKEIVALTVSGMERRGAILLVDAWAEVPSGSFTWNQVCRSRSQIPNVIFMDQIVSFQNLSDTAILVEYKIYELAGS